MPPCVLHEDDHLLVVNKPAGWNTHAPSPHSGEGIYDWLRQADPRWASLALLHRLDKETSGILVFGRTRDACQALAAQFEGRTVRKRYRLFTAARVSFDEHRVRSAIVRAGERYLVRPLHTGQPPAETRFRVLGRRGDSTELEAEPLTGLTHQIRAHAAAEGFPILGDALYGGARFHRLCLHAESVEFEHPGTHQPVRFEAGADFETPRARALRGALIDPGQTNAYRLIHGAGDGWPGLYLDRWGDWLLAQTAGPPATTETVRRCAAECAGPWGLYGQILERRLDGRSAADLAPRLLAGPAAPADFRVRENGVAYEIRLGGGYSVGLFLDQRENRRRLLVNHIAAGFPVRPGGLDRARVLNLFAYTCGFSVCAARAGAATTSVDLSRTALDWGRRNFAHNGLDPAGQEFLQGDAFDWLRRLRRKDCRFDVVILDPPTFSRSKARGVFRAESDYGSLVVDTLPLLEKGGVLFAATNATQLAPGRFLEVVRGAVSGAGRRVLREHYCPQPPDFPITRDEPAHLKTAWFQVG